MEENKNEQTDNTLQVNEEGFKSLIALLDVLIRCECNLNNRSTLVKPYITNTLQTIHSDFAQQKYKRNKMCIIKQSQLKQLQMEIDLKLTNCIKNYKDNIYIHYLLESIYEIIRNFEANNAQKRIEYQKLVQFKTKSNRIFQFFVAFNNNSTILFVGHYENQIKVYGLNNKNKLVKRLPQDEKIFCKQLVWLNKSNQLIMVTDLAILLLKKQWNSSNKILELQDFRQAIKGIIINQQEDLIITGSEDGAIKFWKNVNQGWRCQQTIKVLVSVISLSLNFSQNILISCDFIGKIVAIEQLPDCKWSIIQVIQVPRYGSHLIFLNDNQFALLKPRSGNVRLYNFQQENKQFIKTKTLKLQKISDPDSGNLFIQFIQQKNILIVKHYKFINVIKILENGDFVLQQIIEFNDYILAGAITNDGEYLVIENVIQQKIQIRKLRNLY